MENKILQEQKENRHLRGEKRNMEAKMQNLEEEVRDLKRRLTSCEERGRVGGGEGRGPVEPLEEEVRDLKRRLTSCEERGRVGGGEGRGPVEPLEGRVAALEASVQRALEDVFPRVNVLVAHLEGRSPPEAPPAPTSSTPSTASASATSSRAPAPRRSQASELHPSAASAPPPPDDSARRRTLGVDLVGAAEEGRLEDVRWLLDAGADLNYAGLGYTPLIRASWNGHASVASLLLQRGADVNATAMGGHNRWTALHWAAFNDPSGRCAAALVTAGARVDARDKDGRTPLHRAAERNNEVAARALVAAGASTTLRDNIGKTPLDRARTDALRRLLRP